MGNWHLESLLEVVHEFHSQIIYHDIQEELVEDEINQEIKEYSQDLFEGTSDDSPSLLCEAQENIQPQNQPSQEKENCFTSIQRKRKMPPLLTEEEINQMLNIQPASKPSCEQNIFVHSHTNIVYHKSESELIDQFKEEETDNPICLIDEIIYVHDSPNFDQSDDDDVLQTEANLAEPSAIDLGDEFHYHQIESSNHPRQVTYDTDEESLEIL